MPFNRPTLVQLRERIATDIEYRMVDGEGIAADAHTPGTGYTELANVMAGVAHMLLGNQQWIAAQILVQTCDDDVLEQKATELGLQRIPAAFATGSIAFTGSAGVMIAAGAVYQTSAGIQYRLSANVTIGGGGTATGGIIALMPGMAGNLASGAPLSAVNPVPGVDSHVVTSAAISGGADVEDIERLRDRVLANLRQPPMGGNNYDYVAWAKAVSVDITRAWTFAHEDGIGSVTLRFVCENLPDPMPTPTMISAVQTYIDNLRAAGLRSFTADTFTPMPLNLVFTQLGPNTADVHAAIEAEIKDLIRRTYTPGGTLPLSQLREAISRATGEYDHVMTLASNLTFSNNEYPTWGTPTWPA